jgi:hypothetical protein
MDVLSTINSSFGRQKDLFAALDDAARRLKK